MLLVQTSSFAELPPLCRSILVESLRKHRGIVLHNEAAWSTVTVEECVTALTCRILEDRPIHGTELLDTLRQLLQVELWIAAKVN